MAVAVLTGRLKTYASFTKIEHTIFSLPLILAGTVLGLGGWPSARLGGLVVLAAAGARIVAMGLNRLIDADIDARNPRTRQRELPRGAMSRGEAWVVVALAGAVYLASAAALAPICLWLSPIPVALFVIYPYLKRFTALSHLGLGLTWSMAPLGGWLAGSQGLAGVAQVGWLWAFALLWVTGFDIIYATMDEAFDREEGLGSLPARYGGREALRMASAAHLLAFIILIALWWGQGASSMAMVWLIGIGGLFIWQHVVAQRNPAFAFFHLNAILGFSILGMVVAGFSGT